MEETILMKLREEHKEILTMLLRVERSKTQEKRRESFEQLKRLLIPHMEGEEETLYAKLKKEVEHEEALELAETADFEHREIRDLISMLEGKPFDSEDWIELFDDLKENIMSHFEEEETDLFSEAKEDFSREELVAIAGEFEEAKSHASFH